MNSILSSLVEIVSASHLNRLVVYEHSPLFGLEPRDLSNTIIGFGVSGDLDVTVFLDSPDGNELWCSDASNFVQESRKQLPSWWTYGELDNEDDFSIRLHIRMPSK